LTDDDFRNEIVRLCSSQALKFSWDKTAAATVDAYGRLAR